MRCSLARSAATSALIGASIPQTTNVSFLVATSMPMLGYFGQQASDVSEHLSPEIPSGTYSLC